MTRMLLAAGLLLGLVLPAGAQTTIPAAAADTSKGRALVDGQGMTLYTFDRDTAGKSACNGPCAQNWPPLAAATSANATGNWSIITREDGSRQWAYKGRPLYAWSKDMKPGDATGDGFNGVWHIAQP